jgi:hypothetical protein
MAVKKRVKREIVSDKTAKYVPDQKGNEHLIIIEEKVFYSFTNVRPGSMFFKREDGKEDYFAGHETKDDITPRESDKLKKSKDFENGWLVEEKESDFENRESKNALSDRQLKELVSKNLNRPEEFKMIIGEISSEFTVRRIKDALVDLDAPGSLLAFCDFKLKEIEEKYIEEQRAPIDRGAK